MKSLLPLTACAAPALLASLLVANANAHQSDQPPPAVAAQMNGASLSIQAGLAGDHVLYDEPGDGRLWALGRSWKASFGPDGARYYPRVGAQHERSFAHVLSPESVTVGGQQLAFTRDVSATHEADHVQMDRGAFVETYDLGALSVEQSFVFDALPRSGDLVVQLRTSSDVEPADTGDGVELRSASGRVTYSRATAIDAHGKRVQAVTHVENGSIVIRVGADFLATAAMPLVVDPFILNPIFPDNTQNDTFSMDTAYDAFNGSWLVVWEQVFSSTDHDVYAQTYNSNGFLTASATVDFTTDLWAAPRCANLGGVHQFLVVGGVTEAVGGAKVIRGRTVQPNGTILTQGTQFTISDSSPNDKVRPDVGGDPYAGFAYYCVVWEHDINNAIPVPDHRIEYQLVDSTGHTVTSTAMRFTQTPVEEGYPSISKSDDAVQWLVAWQQQDQLTHGDIHGAYLTWSGNPAGGPFLIAGGNSYDAPPSASSPIHNTNRFAVTFHRGISPHRDIMVSALEGTTVLQTVDLSNLENSGFASSDQIEPSIDSDGEHFLVSYSEYLTAFLYYEIWVSELGLAGNQLTLVQTHVQPQVGLGLSQRNSQVAAAHATGALARRYLVVYDFRQNDTDHDLGGRFFDGLEGGAWGTFCAGDGTGTACPCGNNGASGHGCGNSTQSQGAFLQVLGGSVASTHNDTVHMQVVQIPVNAACLFFQGTTMGAGAVFGDGLRCATGAIIRLSSRSGSPTGAFNYPEGSEPAISVKGGVPSEGGVRAYQVWYRNAATFCTASTFNLSNGVFVNWTP